MFFCFFWVCNNKLFWGLAICRGYPEPFSFRCYIFKLFNNIYISFFEFPVAFWNDPST